MAFYQDRILPYLVHVSMRQAHLKVYRNRIVAQAEGRVLEIGVGSGLNTPLYTQSTPPHLPESGACASLRLRGSSMNNPALALSLLVLAGIQSAQQSPVEALMKAKAGYAHRLLDAVVLGDLETVRDQAFRLKAVAETGDWNVMTAPEYVRESEEFIHATEGLLQSAAGKDRDAVALAYVEVTLSCVRCHRYVRAHR